jgi:hypothetical protein
MGFIISSITTLPDYATAVSILNGGHDFGNRGRGDDQITTSREFIPGWPIIKGGKSNAIYPGECHETT